MVLRFQVRQQQMVFGIIAVSMVLSALLFAHGCTRILAANFITLDPSIQPTRPSLRAALSSSRLSAKVGSSQDPSGVLKRNIFDSALGPMDQAPVDAMASDEPVTIDPNAPPPPCDGALKLVGSYAIPKLPEHSFAAISTGAGGLLFRQGMAVDGRTIAEIRSEAVYLRKGTGGLCALTMFSPAMGTRPLGGSPSVTAMTGTEETLMRSTLSSNSTDLPAADLQQGIEKLSDTSYNIKRSLVDKLLENQSALMRAARITPIKEGERVSGVRLSSIRPNTLLSSIGMKNGDVLRTINGFDMADPSAALQAYARLRNESSLTVSVLRNGAPVTLTYNIR
ncbi:MAG: hypothetical protein H6715_05085 [Myxococcales bacterium]|nr:hypothetical protein [Myxococcales bacterium]MCB9709275.1 hypothetical protein [Myxococcales bacterium]